MDSDFSNTIHVLIIENNPVDSAMLSGMLSQSTFGSFELKTTDSLNHAFHLLTEGHFDVALLDLNLKDSDGLETLYKLHEKFPRIAIVVSTGAYQDTLGLKAITCGAQDYLIKGKYKSYGLVKSLYYAVERKRAEEELKTAYNHLKETQAQLIQVEKMNVIGGLASGVAHEVKNPLATILYGVEFLNTKLKDSDDQVQLTIRSIREATQKANDIIKDLLDFASMSKIKLDRASIHEVIEHALNLTKHQCIKCGINVVKVFDPQVPAILIDKNRIEQVVVDLILNSIFAMPKGGEITVRTNFKHFSSEDSPVIGAADSSIKAGEMVVIVDIEDTGAGLQEEHLSKIFDPFFTTRRAAGGVGLGLSIARTIMNGHAGLIFLSNYDKGARARLVFKTG